MKESIKTYFQSLINRREVCGFDLEVVVGAELSSFLTFVQDAVCRHDKIKAA